MVSREIIEYIQQRITQIQHLLGNTLQAFTIRSSINDMLNCLSMLPFPGEIQISFYKIRHISGIVKILHEWRIFISPHFQKFNHFISSHAKIRWQNFAQ
ncbi:hypothetical protein DK843_03240 [Chromobacterium phragmitis]|uniref:Uncharacterized protein n=1 Tax=Chromobacterium phragmitis TaxID=2202141 RepID=A0A344UDR5_9NEIS|nr:hypothetical protein DK843_03240 [Chromobacterium phragmitis]